MEAIVIPIKGIAMKEIGLMIYLQEMENRNFQMDHTIKGILKTVLKMGKEDIFQIQAFIKEILKMGNLMERVALLMSTTENMLEIGKMVSLKEKDYLHGQMEINIKEST